MRWQLSHKRDCGARLDRHLGADPRRFDLRIGDSRLGGIHVSSLLESEPPVHFKASNPMASNPVMLSHVFGQSGSVDEFRFKIRSDILSQVFRSASWFCLLEES